MNDKDLIKKLNGLKSTKPNAAWVASNRSILLNQISSGSSDTTKIYSFWKKLQIALVGIPQPAFAVFLIGAVLFGSSALSIHAARDSKPGDSLYIAKLANEKAKFAMTFSEEKKARLGLRFAQNRAVELKSVLEEMDNNFLAQDQVEKKEKVAGLVENFKKEINFAKETIEKLNKEKVAVVTTDDSLGQAPKEEAGTEAALDEEEIMMFSANMEKDNVGLQVSGLGDSSTDQATDAVPSVDAGVNQVLPRTASGTGTDDPAATSAPQTIPVPTPAEQGDDLVQHVENLANQTGELLNNQNDIDTEVLNALTDQADAITAQFDQGEVKGATSSNEVINDISQDSQSTSTQ